MRVVNALVIVFGGLLPIVAALKCLTCQSASSIEECDLNGEQQCQINQNSCEVVLRRYKDKISVSKSCKNTQACMNNQLQNNRPSGISTQCNGDQDNSFCTCCCQGDLCNAGSDTCLTPNYVPASPQVGSNDCPLPPRSFPHGNINCENGVCRYECTDETYGLWPVGRDQNVCGADGNWQYDTPCCARPCPPYVLYDAVGLYHFKTSNAAHVWRSLGVLANQTDFDSDSTKVAGVSFGPQPHPSSVVYFNEYGNNKTLMDSLFAARIRPSEEGTPVNIGVAIQYALDNLFQSDRGMRDERVPKAIFITTDSNSDDDVKTVAENARKLGYIIYVYAFEREGIVFDEQQLLDITGEEDHIFRIGDDFDSFPDNWKDDMTKHFCADPCDHVLHDHKI